VYDENNKFDNAENKINDCNDKESLEKVCDWKPTTCTYYLYHDHSYSFHGNGISKSCCNEHQHDHYYFVSEKDAKTDSVRKENACSIHVQDKLRAQRRRLEELKNIPKEKKRYNPEEKRLCPVCGKMMRIDCLSVSIFKIYS
jgi:hypothetical protein